MSGDIDAHAHVWTPDLDRYPLAEGYRREQMSPPSFTPEELLEHARPVGVERIVLIQMSYYQFDNAYMRALFDFAHERAKAGYPWQKLPPGLSVEADATRTQ